MDCRMDLSLFPAILNRPFRRWSPLSQGVYFVFQEIHTYTCLIKIQHMFNSQRSEYLEEKCLLNPKEKSIWEREQVEQGSLSLDGIVIFFFSFFFSIPEFFWQPLGQHFIFKKHSFPVTPETLLGREMGENVSEQWHTPPIPFLFLVLICNHF